MIYKTRKHALIRDSVAPAGHPAPVFVLCDCGAKVPIVDVVNICVLCQIAYSKTGWIIEEE